MKNFDWTSFSKKIAIKSTIAEIYHAWTKASTLETWFLEKVTNTRDGKPLDRSESVTKIDQYEWRWFIYEDTMQGQIKQANGTDFIQFTFGGECLVDVKLEQNGDCVIVNLKQHNIATDEDSMQYVRLGCTNGWTFYLTNLKSVYEGGLDLRNKDANIGTMVNN